MATQAHPYHYHIDKKLHHRLIDVLIPVSLFLLYFFFYNFGKFTPSEMIKTTGLWSISLLGVTLLVGPLARFFPVLDSLKAHRKFWGITSALIATTHVLLVVIFFYKFNLGRLVDISHPKFPGILSGELALIILILVTLTSNNKALTKLDPQVWKAIQLTSYLAMALAISHFYLMELVNGVLVIKRLLGQITLAFAVLVVAVRLLVLLLPARKS